MAAAPAAAVLLLLLLALGCHSERRRSLPDQRLSQLQAMAAMGAMGGQLRQVPIGYGLVDVRKVGKRQSDQHLAQLQTMAALEAMGGRVKQVPLGYGTVDVSKVGRKRAWWPADGEDYGQADDDVDAAPWWGAPALPSAGSS